MAAQLMWCTGKLVSSDVNDVRNELAPPFCAGDDREKLDTRITQLLAGFTRDIDRRRSVSRQWYGRRFSQRTT